MKTSSLFATEQPVPKHKLDPNEFASITRDPVCGAPVNEATALYEECDGNVFYFCSFFCRHKFLAEPSQAAVQYENSRA